jgi:hypothetical protein
VTLDTAHATGTSAFLLGAAPYVQPVSIANASGFPASIVQKVMDYATMLIQQLRDMLGRSIKMPVGEDGGTLPIAALRADKVLVFDIDGNPTVGEDNFSALAAAASASAASAAASAAAAASSASGAAAGTGNWAYFDTEVHGLTWVLNGGAPIIAVRGVYVNGRLQRASLFNINLATGTVTPTFAISGNTDVDINWA